MEACAWAPAASREVASDGLDNVGASATPRHAMPFFFRRNSTVKRDKKFMAALDANKFVNSRSAGKNA